MRFQQGGEYNELSALPQSPFTQGIFPFAWRNVGDVPGIPTVSMLYVLYPLHGFMAPAFLKGFRGCPRAIFTVKMSGSLWSIFSSWNRLPAGYSGRMPEPLGGQWTRLSHGCSGSVVGPFSQASVFSRRVSLSVSQLQETDRRMGCAHHSPQNGNSWTMDLQKRP